MGSGAAHVHVRTCSAPEGRYTETAEKLMLHVCCAVATGCKWIMMQQGTWLPRHLEYNFSNRAENKTNTYLVHAKEMNKEFSHKISTSTCLIFSICMIAMNIGQHYHKACQSLSPLYWWCLVSRRVLGRIG